MAQQRLLDHLRIRKLVRQGARAIWVFCQQILDHASMPPSKQFVQIAELLIKLVVLLRTNQHGLDYAVGSSSNGLSKRADPRIRADSLAILHPDIEQFACNSTINIDACNHEWPEKVTLSALVHTEVRLEHFRQVHFFVAQFRFAENLWLQFKLHELF